MLRPFVLSRASFDRCSGCDNPVKAPLVIVDSGDEYEQQAVRLCYACLKRAVEVATCPACFELNTPGPRNSGEGAVCPEHALEDRDA